jgi:hypothetical protein
MTHERWSSTAPVSPRVHARLTLHDRPAVRGLELLAFPPKEKSKGDATSGSTGSGRGLTPADGQEDRRSATTAVTRFVDTRMADVERSPAWTGEKAEVSPTDDRHAITPAQTRRPSVAYAGESPDAVHAGARPSHSGEGVARGVLRTGRVYESLEWEKGGP